MNDWIDETFDALSDDGLLTHHDKTYKLTYMGTTRALKRLADDEALNFHAYHLELERGEETVAQNRVKNAVSKWLQTHKELAGTPEHILVSLLEGPRVN
jgi:hypothetical protein